LIAFSITVARQSKLFDNVICITNSEEYAEIARHYGAQVPALRPESTATDQSADIDWVKWALQVCECDDSDIFAIVRPTSPFRKPSTFVRAWEKFAADPKADSLRAVRLCAEHPGKMWGISNNRMLPLLPFCTASAPWHSSPYSTLPQLYVQDASLELCRVASVRATNTIAGEIVVPFLSLGYEGFDINLPDDWLLAELLVRERRVQLPKIETTAFFKTY